MNEDKSHSYGHGQYCYYCDVDIDSPEANQDCQETLRKKATPEEREAWKKKEVLIRKIEDVLFDFDIGVIEKWDDMIKAIQKLRPKEGE